MSTTAPPFSSRRPWPCGEAIPSATWRAGPRPAETEVRRLHELRLDARRGAPHRGAPRRGSARAPVSRGPGAGRCRATARTPMGAPRACPVPDRPARRGAPHHPPAQGSALRTPRHRPLDRTSWHWRRPSSARTTRSEGHGYRPGAEPPARTRGFSPTSSTTSTASSAGRRTSRPASGCCRRSSLLALVGPSGSGKSSLLRAGLAAALRDLGGRRACFYQVRAETHSRSGPRSPGHPRRPLQLRPRVRGGLQRAARTPRTQPSSSPPWWPSPRHAHGDHRPAVGPIGRPGGRIRTWADASRRDCPIVAGLGEQRLSGVSRHRPARPGLHLEPGLVDLLVREVRAILGRCPCSRTRCRRPGSDARATPSPWRGTA